MQGTENKMKRFLSWYSVLLKRQLKNISFLILMIVVPVVTVVCSNLSSFKTASIETVAVYAEDDDQTSVRIMESLSNLHTEFKYVTVSSDEELRDMVRSRRALCGFILKKNLTEKFKKEKYFNNIEYIVRNDSIFSDAACEQIYSKYLKEMTYTLALQIIEDSTGVIEGTEGFDIRAEYEELLRRDENEFLKIVFLEENPDADLVSSTGLMTFSISGVMAVIMLLGALMGIGNWISDRKNGVLVPAARGREMLMKVLYIQMPVLLLALSSLITILFVRNFSGAANVLAAVIVYSLMLIILALILSMVVKNMTVLIALEVVLILGSLILCPVFFDFGSIIPVVKVVKYFMPPQWLLMLL